MQIFDSELILFDTVRLLSLYTCSVRPGNKIALIKKMRPLLPCQIIPFECTHSGLTDATLC